MFHVRVDRKIIESNGVIESNRWQYNSNSNRFENMKSNSNRLQCHSHRKHVLVPIPG